MTPAERRGYLRALQDAETQFRRLSDAAETDARNLSSPIEQIAALGRAAGLALAVNWCMWQPAHLVEEK